MLEVFKKLRSIAAATSHEAVQNDLIEEVKSVVQDICNDHIYAAHSFIRDPDLRAAVSKDIQNECQELIEYVVAAKRFNLEVNSRSKDRVVSFGEKLSCRFMTCLLKDRVRANYSHMNSTSWNSSLIIYFSM